MLGEKQKGMSPASGEAYKDNGDILNWADVLVRENYDANSLAITDQDSAAVNMTNDLIEIYFFATEAAQVKINGSDKVIFIPATTWTPVYVKTSSFIAKTVAPGGNGTLYWKGYF